MLFVIACIGGVFAQKQVVYLKNGSVIKGEIVEQEYTNQEVKIKTTDGSIFVYKMSEIEKVSVEEKQNPFKDAFLPAPCYKGFLDFGYTIGVGDLGESRVALSMTHGIQFTPYYFLGAGMGFNYYHKSALWNMPFYVSSRVNFSKRKITPFLDLRIGYSAGEVKGLYFSPELGCNFGFGYKAGFSLSVGYELQRVKMYYYESSYDYEYLLFLKGICGGVSLKLGVNF